MRRGMYISQFDMLQSTFNSSSSSGESSSEDDDSKSFQRTEDQRRHHHHHHKKDQGRVHVEIVSEAPSMIEFLQGVDVRTLSGYKKSRRENLKERPFYFLEKSPLVKKSEEYRLRNNLFVMYAQELVKKYNVETTIVGMTGWSHKTRGVSKLIKELSSVGLFCKTIDAVSNVYFETISVSYASRNEGIQHLDAVLGSGGSSANFMHSMQFPCSVGIGYRQCVDDIRKIWDKTQDANLALDVLRKYMNRSTSRAQNSPRCAITGRIQGEISKALLMMEHKSLGEVKAEDKIKGTIVGISATYVYCVCVCVCVCVFNLCLSFSFYLISLFLSLSLYIYILPTHTNKTQILCGESCRISKLTERTSKTSCTTCYGKIQGTSS